MAWHGKHGHQGCALPCQKVNLQVLEYSSALSQPRKQSLDFASIGFRQRPTKAAFRCLAPLFNEVDSAGGTKQRRLTNGAETKAREVTTRCFAKGSHYAMLC
uniref:Uncharacterized protein n=1 Tax=Caulerpa lentillifera TaxID=148947 RepID=A0A2Z2QKL3_9CHLO|nr:hypothetical protein [Caulerpa lentillifera]AST24248.1 hypothetical protein [Caulerpa lentillifera]